MFSAEAYGLWKAAFIACCKANTIILTDSASCINAIRSGHSSHPWIQAAEKVAAGCNITFCWIPGHAGIPGNEGADNIANQARSKPPPHSFKIPAQDAVRTVKNEIWKAWQNQWNQTQQQLRQIKRTVCRNVDRSCASDQRLLTRLRIGHTRLTHSYLLEKIAPPVCRYCGVSFTVQHILQDCRGFEESRKNNSISGTLPTILANEKRKEISMINFLKETSLYNKI